MEYDGECLAAFFRVFSKNLCSQMANNKIKRSNVAHSNTMLIDMTCGGLYSLHIYKYIFYVCCVEGRYIYIKTATAAPFLYAWTRPYRIPIVCANSSFREMHLSTDGCIVAISMRNDINNNNKSYNGLVCLCASERLGNCAIFSTETALSKLPLKWPRLIHFFSSLIFSIRGGFLFVRCSPYQICLC